MLTPLVPDAPCLNYTRLKLDYISCLRFHPRESRNAIDAIDNQHLGWGANRDRRMPAGALRWLYNYSHGVLEAYLEQLC